jgi:hypothetical protein
VQDFIVEHQKDRQVQIEMVIVGNIPYALFISYSCAEYPEDDPYPSDLLKVSQLTKCSIACHPYDPWNFPNSTSNVTPPSRQNHSHHGHSG